MKLFKRALGIRPAACFATILALALGCGGTARPDAALAAEETLILEYDAPEVSVLWSGGKEMKVARTFYTYDSPISSTPSGMRKEDARISLGKAQVKALRKAVLADADAFFTLDDSYGAPPEERYYPYKLTLRVGSRIKTVLYRSNPGYKEAPPEFDRLVAAISAPIER